MNILIATFTFPPQANGVSHVAYQHAIGFLDRGHEVTVATGFDPRRDCDAFPKGLRVVQFKADGNANLRSRYTGEIRAYQEFIASFTGEIICCHCWQTWVTDIAAKSFADIKAKKILVSHGVSANSGVGWPRSFLAWALWRPYIWWGVPKIIRAVDHVVFLTDMMDNNSFLDRHLIHQLALTNYSVIPNGADMGKVNLELPNFRETYDIGNSWMVLYVSNYEKRKDQRMALNAFLTANVKESVLVFIGSELNDYAKKLQEQYKRTGKAVPSVRVRFLEKVEQKMLLSAYKAADLFICTSKWEAQPLVILDAMASSTPFISTDIGCVRELPGGYVVRSVEEMAQRIRDLLIDTEVRKNLGREGCRACENKYSWQKVVDAYENLFHYLCTDA